MPRIRNQQFETFGDGLLSVFEADERKLVAVKANRVRFGNRTVGIKRFWEAKTAGNKVERMVSIPMEVLNKEKIYADDIVILDSKAEEGRASEQYKIVQVQLKYDSSPPAAYLSLESLVHPFKDGRNGNA